MSTPTKPVAELPFKPKARRQFYLPEVTIQRLGGPVAAEIMRLLVEEEMSEGEIQAKLGISGADYITYVQTHPFRRELKAQLKLREHDAKFKAHGKIRDVPPTQTKAGAGAVPPSIFDIPLPKGVSPQEWALRRINQVTPQAVEKLVWLMHNSKTENVQYNAATKILGLNGIVEVEKSISVIADAESIIRELNRRGPYNKRPKDAEDITDADYRETPAGELSSPVESGPSPQES